MLLYMLVFAVFSVTNAFYLPWLPPVTYCKEETEDCKSDVPVLVNRLHSLETAIPFAYDKFDLCHPSEDGPVPDLNFGQLLSGDRIRSSPYKLKFMSDVECETVCEKTYTRGSITSELDLLQKSIILNYNHNWIIDNMPVTWCYLVEDGNQYCSRGFPLGCYITAQGKKKDSCVMSSLFSEKNTYYFFNHVDLTIEYHPGDNEDWGKTIPSSGRILRAKVVPRSIAYDATATGQAMCQNQKAMGVRGGYLDDDVTIRYTYSVRWKQDISSKWSSRWDYILLSKHDTSIQFSLINSLVIILFLAGLVIRVCLQTMRKEVVAYDNLANSFSHVPDKLAKDADVITQENKPFIAKNKRWKLVMDDVFRPPSCVMLLSSLVGSGVQIFFTCFFTLVIACLGLLSPANRGALMMCIVIVYVCMGLPGGYVSARIYKRFGGERKFLVSAVTSFLCPGLVFVMFLMLNAILLMEGSSSALTYSTVLKLLAFWIGASVPLTFLGACIGFKRAMHIEESFNESPRLIPKRAFYVLPAVLAFGGGLPFICLFIQLFHIMNSLWSYQVYYMFGFLFPVFLCVVILCSGTTIMLCYNQLCAEDYRWWWRSFLSNGFTAVCVYIYCIHYYKTKLELNGWPSTIIYFGYMVVVAFLIFLLTGSVGFYTCYWFVAKLYKTHHLSATSDHIKPPLDNTYDQSEHSQDNTVGLFKDSLNNTSDFTKASLDGMTSLSKQNLLEC